MMCQNCQTAAATIQVTERAPSGAFESAHYCNACGRERIPQIPNECYLKPSPSYHSSAVCDELGLWLADSEPWFAELDAILNACREATTPEQTRAANKRLEAFLESMPRPPGES